MTKEKVLCKISGLIDKLSSMSNTGIADELYHIKQDVNNLNPSTIIYIEQGMNGTMYVDEHLLQTAKRFR